MTTFCLFQSSVFEKLFQSSGLHVLTNKLLTNKQNKRFGLRNSHTQKQPHKQLQAPRQASGSHGRAAPLRSPHASLAPSLKSGFTHTRSDRPSPSMSRADQRREPAATHAKRPLVGRIGSGEGLVSYAGVQIKSCIR